jgi:hypothetical protein
MNFSDETKVFTSLLCKSEAYRDTFSIPTEFFD